MNITYFRVFTDKNSDLDRDTIIEILDRLKNLKYGESER